MFFEIEVDPFSKSLCTQNTKFFSNPHEKKSMLKTQNSFMKLKLIQKNT